MTREEAQALLADRKPGAPPTDDPEVRHALDLVDRDPALRSWFQAQQAFHARAARALRDVPVPADLARQILERRKTARPNFRRLSLALAAAACVAALAIAFSVFMGNRRDLGTDRADFETFRNRMVRAAAREYRMDVVTNDLAAIRSFLARANAPSEFDLPPGLATLPPAGAGLLSWQGRPVSMVCLQGGDRGMLYLFIAPADSLENGGPTIPEIEEVATLSTLSWSNQNRAYVLASHAPLSTADILQRDEGP